MSEKLNIDYPQLKGLIQKSKTKQVLDTLVTQVPEGGSYASYYNTIIILSSDLHELEEERLTNTITTQDYDIKLNKIKVATLRLLDDLKAGRTQPSNKEAKKRIPFWQITLIIFSLIGSIVGISYFFKNPFPPVSKETSWQCPSFRPTANFKVLVLPFQDKLSESNKPHKLIALKLDRFCLEEKLPAGAAILKNDDSIGFLINKEEAAPFIQECMPNMVVWGTAIDANENQDISINYYINDPAELVWLSDYKAADFVDTLLQQPTSYLGYQGATYKIEEILFLLKQAIALKTGNPVAVVNLEKETPAFADKNIQLNSTFILAESYQRIGKPEKAIETYSKALEIAPNDALALNNRAFLNLQQKNLDGALTDYDRMVITKQANYETYIKRAEINEELGNLGEAKKDLNQARQMSPKGVDRVIEKKEKDVNIKIEVLRNSQLPPSKPNTSTNGSNKPTITNPTVNKPVVANTSKNVKAIQGAMRDNQLGDYNLAENKAIQVLKNEPNNEYAIEALIKAKYFQNKDITLPELQKNRYLKNIDTTKLKQYKDPVFKSIIQNEGIKKANFRPTIVKPLIKKENGN